MATFPPALAFSLHFEDPEGKYEKVPDVGGWAIAGINSRSFPEDFAAIVALSLRAARAARVANFYERKFWDPMMLAGITSQELANRVFDCGVNEGPVTSIRILQRTVNDLGGHLEIDSTMGPETLKAVNAANPQALLTMFRNQRIDQYQFIAERNPDLKVDLPVWLERAKA